MPEPALLDVSPVGSVMFSASSWLLFYCEYRHTLWKCVTVGYSVMSQSHKIKGRTTDEVFQALQELLLWK